MASSKVQYLPRSPALGPVASWTQHRRNTRMQIQFRARNSSLVTDSSTDCSFCPHGEIERAEYTEKSDLTPLESSYTYVVIPLIMIVVIGFWLGQELTRCLSVLQGKSSALTVATTCVLCIAWYGLAYMEHNATIRHQNAWKVKHNCSAQCMFTTAKADAAEAETIFPFHKTLFICPHSVNCPAERLYFDEGAQKLSTCTSPQNNGLGGWWCGASNESIEAADMCFDVANWTSKEGRTCQVNFSAMHFLHHAHVSHR
eukprot:SAG11_NODE_235_length_11852_cov_4.266020_4_plen_257_part_00